MHLTCHKLLSEGQLLIIEFSFTIIMCNKVFFFWQRGHRLISEARWGSVCAWGRGDVKLEEGCLDTSLWWTLTYKNES